MEVVRRTEGPEMLLVMGLVDRKGFRVLDLKAGPRATAQTIGSRVFALISRSFQDPFTYLGRYMPSRHGAFRFAAPGLLFTRRRLSLLLRIARAMDLVLPSRLRSTVSCAVPVR